MKGAWSAYTHACRASRACIVQRGAGDERGRVQAGGWAIGPAGLLPLLNILVQVSEEAEVS